MGWVELITALIGVGFIALILLRHKSAIELKAQNEIANDLIAEFHAIEERAMKRPLTTVIDGEDSVFSPDEVRSVMEMVFPNRFRR